MTSNSNLVFVLIMYVCLTYCSCQAISRTNNVERDALLEFKHGINIDHCNLLTSWSGALDHCQWHGIQCDNKTGHVVMLHLAGFPSLVDDDLCLQGRVSASISKLKHLQHLDLSYNNFQGQSIPKFIGSLPNLRHLKLSNVRFRGVIPHEIGNLSRLSSLDLNCLNDTTCSMRVESLSWLSSLSFLRDVNLGGVNFSHVPNWVSKINNLPYLEVLRMDSCSLSVQLSSPLSYTNASSNIHVISLSGNNFEGTTIFEWLYNLTQIATNLVYLDLSSSQISGNIPSFIWKMTSVSYLDLSVNSFNGQIPSDIGSMRSLEYLNMSYNMIHGEFPDLSFSFQSLIEIDLSSNNLSGAIPSFLGTSFTRLNLNNNQLSKGLYHFLCPKTEMGLMHLDLSNNLFSEAIPDCWSYFPNLKVLNLENNSITGNLPSSITSLNTLQALHLRNNNLHGELPKSWTKSTSLAVLDLGYNSISGHIPPTFVHGLKNLNILTLRNNKLSKGIPSSLCQLSCLQILDISGNEISGTLPNCLYNLKGMANTSNFTQACAFIYVRQNWLSGDIAWFMWKRKEHSFADSRGLLKGIDISNNNLQGQIPDDITSLVGLVFLNLSLNNLSSVIPSSIGQLTSLEFLDLSHNHLSGKIPTSLGSINYLEILDLSTNNLSGRIPLGTQLQGFDASAYMGNPGLCGAPLTSCFEDEPNPPLQYGDKTTHKYDDFILGLIISVVFGFIIGFWGVCGTLVMKRSWRIALFRFYDNVADKLYVTRDVNDMSLLVELSELTPSNASLSSTKPSSSKPSSSTNSGKALLNSTRARAQQGSARRLVWGRL